MKACDQKSIAASPEAYVRGKMAEAPALKVLFLSITLESRHIQDYCLKVMAYGIAELPWLPTMTAKEAEILVREERGRGALVEEVAKRMPSYQGLEAVRGIWRLIDRGRHSNPEATDATLYHLACLSWLWMLDHDLFMRSVPELKFEEVVIEMVATA